MIRVRQGHIPESFISIDSRDNYSTLLLPLELKSIWYKIATKRHYSIHWFDKGYATSSLLIAH
jgi:hypothetical protein